MNTTTDTPRPRRRAQPQILGVGELILDHVWDTGGGAYDGRLHVSRGGGSVLNVLANLAQVGWDARCAGVVGADEAGALATEDLASLGVDVSAVRSVTGRRTRLIFELLGVENATQVGGAAHSFTTKCPVCTQRMADSARPAMRVPESDLAGGGWAIYDQLTAPRVAHAQNAREHGMTTVLDLGAVSYLRYQPTPKILAQLRHFDLVFLNGKVAASLARRAEVTDVDLVQYVPDSVLVITQGRHGALVTAANGFRQRVPAPHTTLIVDDSGAGDALCAHTLNHLARATPTGFTGTPLLASAVFDAVTDAENYVAAVLGKVGARGHLPDAPTGHRFSSLTTYTLPEMQRLSWRRRQCVLCDLPMDSPPAPLTILADTHLGSRPTANVAAAAAADDTEAQNSPDRAPSDSYSGSGPSGSATKASPHPRVFEEDEPPLFSHLSSDTNTGATAGARRTAKTGARRNTSLLPHRMLAAAEQTDAVAVARSILRGPRSTVQVVGSGGSLPTATFIAELLNHAGHFAVACTPGEYLGEAAAADVVIVVSYSGSTRDLATATEAARKRSARQIVLLTGSRTPSIAALLRPMTTDVVLTYAPTDRDNRSRPVRERGFVSIAGTVAPCVPWLAAAAGMAVVVDMVNRIETASENATVAAKSLSERAATLGRLHVVYGPSGKPAALDIESKFTESGLPAVTMHEQKDLSHGRFMTVLHPVPGTGHAMAPVLILAAGATTRYQAALCRSLDEARVPYASIRSTVSDESAALELLTAVQTFSQQVGSDLGIDISRPRSIPSEGLRLYKWRGPLP